MKRSQTLRATGGITGTKSDKSDDAENEDVDPSLVSVVLVVVVLSFVLARLNLHVLYTIYNVCENKKKCCGKSLGSILVDGMNLCYAC
jgi:hypothetical protein